MKLIAGNRAPLEEKQFIQAEAAGFYAEHARRFMGPLYRRLAARAARINPPGTQVLDMGTGTGLLAVALAKARPDWHVTGTDISEEMLKLARENAARNGLAGKIDFRLAPATALPFQDGHFALITSNASLHLWTDPQKIFREIDRVTVPGGYLLLRDNLRLTAFLPFFNLIGCALGMNKDQRQLWLRAIKSSYSPGEARALLKKSPLKDARVSFTRFFEIDIYWKKPA